MSERSHAPRPGGRATEQRSTTDARRRTGAVEARGARGARPADDARGRSDRTREPRDSRDAREASRPAEAAERRRGAETSRQAGGVSRPAAKASRLSEGTSRATAGASRLDEGASRVTARASRLDEAAGRRRGTADGGRRRAGGAAAATQGTAALKLDAVAEPLRVTEAAAAPRLRVAPPVPISAPRAPFIAGVIALVVAGVIGILLINTKTNENSFEISRLREQQAALDTQQQQLENQLATYDSAGSLDAAAKRLGLVRADAPAYIRLPDGKVIGVPRPGTGKPAVTAQDAAGATGSTAGAVGDTATGGAAIGGAAGTQGGVPGVTQGQQAGTVQGQQAGAVQGQQAGTVQGVQGQPVQGQPVQGQPVQGQPVQGQPVQGQPVAPGAGE